MQWPFLVHSDVSEDQQEQVRIPPGAFLYSDLKSFLKKNSILKIKARHQTGDLPFINTQCFHYGGKISSPCSNRQPSLYGEVVKQNAEAFMQVILFLESVKRCDCLRLPFSWLHCGGAVLGCEQIRATVKQGKSACMVLHLPADKLHLVIWGRLTLVIPHHCQQHAREQRPRQTLPTLLLSTKTGAVEVMVVPSSSCSTGTPCILTCRW